MQDDPFALAFGAAAEFVIGSVAFVVGALTDLLLSVAPRQASRVTAQNCIKTGLVLLGLGLLQSVLSTVLTIGVLVLMLYTATQVFGLQIPVPRQSTRGNQQPGTATGEPWPDPNSQSRHYNDTDGWQSWQERSSAYSGQQYQQQGQQYRHDSSAANANAYSSQGQGRWSRHRGTHGRGPQRRPAYQDDVIDVFYEKQ